MKPLDDKQPRSDTPQSDAEQNASWEKYGEDAYQRMVVAFTLAHVLSRVPRVLRRMKRFDGDGRRER